MPEEFEGDLAGAVFWGADPTGARFRDFVASVTTTDLSRTIDVLENGPHEFQQGPGWWRKATAPRAAVTAVLNDACNR